MSFFSRYFSEDEFSLSDVEHGEAASDGETSSVYDEGEGEGEGEYASEYEPAQNQYDEENGIAGTSFQNSIVYDEFFYENGQDDEDYEYGETDTDETETDTDTDTSESEIDEEWALKYGVCKFYSDDEFQTSDYVSESGYDSETESYSSDDEPELYHPIIHFEKDSDVESDIETSGNNSTINIKKRNISSIYSNNNNSNNNNQSNLMVLYSNIQLYYSQILCKRIRK